MNMQQLFKQAATNRAALEGNPYPGRGIGIGLNKSGKHLILVTFVTGRSGGSRNRRYKLLDHGRVDTEVADLSKETGDPEKTIYSAMAGHSGVYLASNGRQTDTVFECWGVTENDFERAMNKHTYENDSISTPRITAVCVTPGNNAYTGKMSILRRSPFGTTCERNFFNFEEFCPGIGHFLTTYLTDGNPPPIYQGEPFFLPLVGDNPTDIAEEL